VGALLYKNAVIEETGLAAAVLNHPATGVAWLANKIAPYGGCRIRTSPDEALRWLPY